MASFKFPKLSPIQRDRYFVPVLIFWILSLLISFAAIFYFKNNLPRTVPLFYSRIWGEERLADNGFLFLLPLGSLFFGIFNLVFSARFFSEEKFITRILQITTVVLSVLTLFSVINIINLVR